jgi:predicted membrane GTPase involved in stress response
VSVKVCSLGKLGIERVYRGSIQHASGVNIVCGVKKTYVKKRVSLVFMLTGVTLSLW